MVAFNETTMEFNVVVRVLLNKQDGDAYAIASGEIFIHVTKIHPSFKNGQTRVEFDQEEYNGFDKSIGVELCEKILCLLIKGVILL